MSRHTGIEVPRKYIDQDIIEAEQPPCKTERQQKVTETLLPLKINKDYANTVECRMFATIKKGLKKETNALSSVKCFPTFVQNLPTGKEECRCLALDLGGTNLRCILVQIKGQEEPKMVDKKTVVPDNIMKGSGEDLFDFVADQLNQFQTEQELNDQEILPLGFCFSFPCKQTGLASAELTHWTKGFKCSGVEGENVGALMSKAMAKKGVKAKVVAVLNDTTGCFMSCAWKDSATRVGLIIGTGTNVCYLEKAKNVELADGINSGGMVVNTEWGAFGQNGELDFLLTEWDVELDKKTINPGQQVMEKMISGMYLGELIRIILIDLYKRDLLLKGIEMKPALQKSNVLDGRHLVEVESDPVGEITGAVSVWNTLGVENPSREDCQVLREVCETVSDRCCLMLAAGLAAVLKKIDEKDVTIAVDGSLFKYHPLFGKRIEYRLQQLMGEGYKFKLLLSEDGSGKGAALVAASLAHTLMEVEKPVGAEKIDVVHKTPITDHH